MRQLLPSTVMMLALDDACIEREQARADAVEAIADAGFRGVAAMVRGGRYAWDDVPAQRALADVGALCAARGLGFWLIADPRGMRRGSWSREGGVDVLLFGDAPRAEHAPAFHPVVDGRVEGVISLAPRRVHTMPEGAIEYRPVSLVRAWLLPGAETAPLATDVRDVTASVHWWYDAVHRRVELFGCIDDAPVNARVVAALRCRSTHVDFSSDAHIDAYCAALAALHHAGVRPDALLWDEAGYTCLHGSLPLPRSISDELTAAADHPAGDPLRLLVLDDAEGAHIRVRTSWYASLQETVGVARRRANDAARRLWGDLVFGMHDTWRWESADASDMLHGSLDLWRAAETKSCGFTDLGSAQLLHRADAPFHANLAAALVAAVSLARHAPVPAAWVNLWTAGDEDWQPDVLAHAVDAMAAFGCRWIGHIYGPAGVRGEEKSFLGLPPTPGYPAHGTWPFMRQWTARLSAQYRACDDGLPEASVCVVFPVEALHALGPARASLAMEDVFRLILALLDAHHQVHLVSSALLEDARWEGTQLVTGHARCRAVIVPHAQVIPHAAVRLLAEQPAAVRAMFEPPEFDTTGTRLRDTGITCASDFIDLLGWAHDCVGDSRILGPAHSWVTRTRCADGDVYTLVPARTGYVFRGELRLQQRTIPIPSSTSLMRVHVGRADAAVRIVHG